MPLHRLTVLSKVVDPFRKDTPANHRDAEWVAAGIIRGSKESRRTQGIVECSLLLPMPVCLLLPLLRSQNRKPSRL